LSGGDDGGSEDIVRMMVGYYSSKEFTNSIFASNVFVCCLLNHQPCKGASPPLVRLHFDHAKKAAAAPSTHAIHWHQYMNWT
jgi:hypothetical protein